MGKIPQYEVLTNTLLSPSDTARSGSGLFISLLVSPTIVRRHFYFSNSWTSFEIITLFFFVFKNNYSISLTFHIFCHLATVCGPNNSVLLSFHSHLEIPVFLKRRYKLLTKPRDTDTFFMGQ